MSASTFDLEAKTWTEAFQATQKRIRTGVILSAFASCIVLLMVFNLFEARKLRNLESISTTAESSEYMKEVSRHVADESFYQLPTLGMQITCDNVGFFGPLALLIFSLYSVMAFKAFDCHVRCGSNFPNSDLKKTLLETSQFNTVATAHALRLLLFLPLTGCLSVIVYVIFAHFRPPVFGDPLNEIRSQMLAEARILDWLGLVCTVMVMIYNFRTVKFFGDSQEKIARCLDTPAQAKSTAA